MAKEKMPVLDSAARETGFVVDGSTYRLRYGFDAIAGFEEGTGINPALGQIPPTIFNLMCLLYVGLREHHPEVGIETVKSWFNQDTSDELGAIAWKAFYKTVQKTEPQTGENPDPPSA